VTGFIGFYVIVETWASSCMLVRNPQKAIIFLVFLTSMSISFLIEKGLSEKDAYINKPLIGEILHKDIGSRHQTGAVQEGTAMYDKNEIDYKDDSADLSEVFRLAL
jgi:hypothetical protein